MSNPILTVVPLLVLLTGFAVADSSAGPEGGSTVQTQKPVAFTLPEGKLARPVGLAALDVSAAHESAYSVEAIQKFLQTHNLPRNMGPMADIHVVRVEILADQEVGARLNGMPIDLGPNDKVVLATLSGTFIFYGPSKNPPMRAKYAYAAFDSTSGNLLMAGTLSADAAKKMEQLK